jgi:tRNA-Thr(GGU) m(6)t(6)A37 methyltransferase TsaA
MADSRQYVMQAIGLVHSCFGDKFGVPRQPGLVAAAEGVIELYPQFAGADAVRGLEQFSHLWVLFAFHQTAAQGWKPLVRPPRLGGNQSIGVYASRSMFRPNPIGLSVVRLQSVEVKGDSVRLHISGQDLINGTPVLDLKPYIRYSDLIADAKSGYADLAPAEAMAVEFSAEAGQALKQLQPQYPGLELLIQQVLAQDPRPAYHQNNARREYGMTLYDLNITWIVEDNIAHVTRIEANR